MRPSSNVTTTARLCDRASHAKPAARPRQGYDGAGPHLVACARNARFEVWAASPTYAPGRRVLAGGGGGLERERVKSGDEHHDVSRWDVTEHTTPTGNRFVLTIRCRGERVYEHVFDTKHAAIAMAESKAECKLEWQRERARGRGRKRAYRKLPNRGHDEQPAKASGKRKSRKRQKRGPDKVVWHEQACKDARKNRGIVLVPNSRRAQTG